MFYQRKSLTRENLTGKVEAKVRQRVATLAIRYNCSKSFVTNTLLAEILDIKPEETIYDVKKRESEARSHAAGRGKAAGKPRRKA